jgi:hypothetical protein
MNSSQSFFCRLKFNLDIHLRIKSRVIFLPSSEYRIRCQSHTFNADQSENARFNKSLNIFQTPY